jgi:hypothetical protein
MKFNSGAELITTLLYITRYCTALRSVSAVLCGPISLGANHRYLAKLNANHQ